MRIKLPKNLFIWPPLAEVVKKALLEVNKRYELNPVRAYDVDTKSERCITLTLRVTNSALPPARMSPSGRRTNSANWEAHKYFMRAVLTLIPEATIQTSVATYKGLADFEANHEAIADYQVGSKVKPKRLGEL
ncbi:hypothetical protein EBZ39_16230 [bacterium]|nr:hypothetical protein [bacterium]